MKLKFAGGLDLLIISGFLACLLWAQREKENVVPKADFNVIENEDEDADYIRYAIASNHAEIQLAKVALSKSADQQIKDIAAVIEKDHSMILASFTQMAFRKNIQVEKFVDPWSGKKITELSGTDFDKQWCADMIGSHETGFLVMEAAWEKSYNAEVKGLISASLPHLIAHLEWLVDYQENLGRRQRNTSPVKSFQIATN